MIQCDLCGPMAVQTSSQKQYAAIFVDDFSRYVHLFLLRLKSDFFETFTYFANAIENETDSKLAFFKSDGDGIFSEKNDKFEAFLQSKGIQHIFSTPYCPSQNGRVERVIRTIVEMARTIMIHGDASRSLWGEAMSQAVYVYNRLPHGGLPKQFSCPLAAWRGITIADPCRDLRVPFCLAYAQINSYLTKFDKKATACILLGNDSKRSCYRLLRQSDRSLVYSRDSAMKLFSHLYMML